MPKPILNFAHSNGFPKGSYVHLFDYLEDQFEIVGKEMLVHDERFQVKKNWDPIASEIIDYLDEHNYKSVIGLGHSLGATSTLIAAIKRPDLFSSIVLLDPVLVVGRVPEVITEVLKKTGFISKFTPADTSKDRKRHWETKEEALEYFKTKKFFEPFTERSLQAYVDSGLIQNDSGYALKYKVENEVKVFVTPPNFLRKYNSSPLKVPGIIFHGKTSEVSKLSFIKRLSKIHNLEHQAILGSHMFPLEFPQETANEIKNYLKGKL